MKTLKISERISNFGKHDSFPKHKDFLMRYSKDNK
jgi:hypothetical protein